MKFLLIKFVFDRKVFRVETPKREINFNRRETNVHLQTIVRLSNLFCGRADTHFTFNIRY